MDQGTNLTSWLLHEICGLLEIWKLRMSICHPQMDGLVEHFNETLKGMLQKFPPEDLHRWDQLIPPLLLAMREVPQAFTPFSPYKLLYRCQRLMNRLLQAHMEYTAAYLNNIVIYSCRWEDHLD